MKKLTYVILLFASALMLTSCSLGIKKMLGMAPTAKPTKVKIVKATKTPGAAVTEAATQAATAAANAIAITSAGFQPNTLDVTAGTTVTWTNSDTAPHSVTSDTAGIFDSGPIQPGATFTYTFAQAGTCTYHSNNEPSLTGTVTVK